MEAKEYQAQCVGFLLVNINQMKKVYFFSPRHERRHLDDTWYVFTAICERSNIVVLYS